MRMRKWSKKQVFMSLALVSALSIWGLAGNTKAAVDVAPPYGRLNVAGAIEQGGESYVSERVVTVKVYATDNVSSGSGIKVYFSRTPIEMPPASGTSGETGWENYYDGMTKEFPMSEADGESKIYAIFKDEAGNTSKVFTSAETKYEITYDFNGGQGIEIEKQTGYYGMPQSVSSIKPHKEGSYFLGWSMTPGSTGVNYKQNDIIPAYALNGLNTKNIVLYAVWTDDVTKLPTLSSRVHIGDYVNYPAYYDNMPTSNTAATPQAPSTLNGWRVISKDVDLSGDPAPGTVNLVSAGAPLTFYNFTGQATSLPALLKNFLTTPFGMGSQVATFRLNGFSSFASLKEIFTNEFTETNASGDPKVRSMVKEDILRITGEKDLVAVKYYSDNKYDRLFKIDTYYWLASANPHYDNCLWGVYPNGRMDTPDSVNELGVRPVVSLKPEVRTEGLDANGNWSLEM